MNDSGPKEPKRIIHIGFEHPSCKYDPATPPVAYAHLGDLVVAQTHCCAKESVTRSISTTPETFYTELGYYRGKTLTGPIAVPEAQVGDILAVDILNVEVADQGWTMAMKDRGAIGHRIETGESRVLPIEKGCVVFQEHIRFPIRPMIGCIGTTPAQAVERTGLPGGFGGNMDCKLVGAGTTLFLPVLIPGAHLALGDLHAVQGDGETGCAGAEIAGLVTMEFRLLRGLPLPMPLLETSDRLMTIYSAGSLDQAAIGATERLAEFLASQSALSLAEAAMLLSLTGDVRICQNVNNPIMTCRMEVPKTILAQLDIDLAALWQKWEVQPDPAVD